MYTHTVNETRVESSFDRIESKNLLVVNFFIYNHEGRDLNYTFYLYINGNLKRSETVNVLKDEYFQLNANVPLSDPPLKQIRCTVYRENESKPIKDITQYF